MRLIPASLAALVAFAAAASVGADGYPHRKPGLWQVTTSSPDSKTPSKSARVCIDKATESALVNAGVAGSKKMCSKSEVRFEGLHGTADTVCRFGTSTQTAHSEITFAGDSAYRIETQAHYDPPLFGKSNQRMLTEGKWTGPCPIP
jgi:uncharacterized protein DUF3617